VIALKWMLVVALGGYGAVAALLYVAQRAMMYVPDTARIAPARAGLAGADEFVLETADGERIVAWHVAPRERRPVVVYFHGNGGNVSYRAPRFRALADVGLGVLAVSYRGYGGSSGRPSEAGLIVDAAAAYAEASRRYAADRVVLWGESLGTGVAVALAAERPVKALVLESPFASTLEIAARAYPVFPVAWLMKDQFRSDLRIGKVTAPVLVMHGGRDSVVPIASGERLFDLVAAPKRFVRFPDGEHNDLDDFGATATAIDFIAALP
jgi:fermentation-respiration switch protein FrsA (DUF1100 family)